MLKKMMKGAARLCGFEISRASSTVEQDLPDLSPEVRAIVGRARPYTMTSTARLASVCLAVQYVVANRIPGSFVECGVWKGGSSMAAAWMYGHLGWTNTDLYLFDTFEGMSQPTVHDVRAQTGESAADLLAQSKKTAEVWAWSPLAEVQRNLESTGYPHSRIHLIQGRVEDTIPQQAPAQISLLRLDTDWYESTRHELVHLFPRLSKRGLLIIDDYGAWAGARKAVDEYFGESDAKPFLARIDDTGRICTKM
jgi:O-methyltransferase